QAGKELSRWELPPGAAPRELAFSPNGARVFCISSDNHFRAWDIKTRQETSLWQLSGDLRTVHGFSPDGSILLVASNQKNYLLDLNKNQKQVLPGMERSLGHASFSPDGSCVAIASDNTGVRFRLCDVATGKTLWRAPNGVGAFVYSIRFSPS